MRRSSAGEIRVTTSPAINLCCRRFVHLRAVCISEQLQALITHRLEQLRTSVMQCAASPSFVFHARTASTWSLPMGPNVVSIGYAEGPLVTRAVNNAGADHDAVSAQRDGNVPRGKQITTEEVANVALFLASDASSAINATEVYADGGNHCTTYGP